MNFGKCILILGGTLCVLWGCHNAPKSPVMQTRQGASIEDSIQVTEREGLFEKETHNFGSIRQGEEVSVRFYFTNPGPDPLIIEKVKTGCGCTLAEYPQEPIGKNQRKFVEVIFNSQGRFGLQYQEVKVQFADTRQPTCLTIVAQVREN